jgi:glutaminase
MTGARFVSTGRLPAAKRMQPLVTEAYERFRANEEGAVSTVYPALARVPGNVFGICVAATSGALYAAGDAELEFTIMSVAKPFAFALVCRALGPDEVRAKVGVNATGRPFNSQAPVEESPDGRTNPMVNSGAIATTSLLPGLTAAEKWRFLQSGLSRFAARELTLDDEVYESASETNHRNRKLARLLERRNRIYCDPAEAVDLYTRQSSLSVSARDLAVMGATLADGGVNPVSGERVIDADTCRFTLAVMATAGLYETSGDWLYDVGLPGKSGIGGGIVTVAPGKAGLGTFAPLLDGAGNSVKGQLAARFLAASAGLDPFASKPER